MDRNKYIQQILLGLFLTLLWACDNSKHENKRIETSEVNSVTGVSFNDNKYQIDTAVILTHQNLLQLINELDTTPLLTNNSVKYIPRFIRFFLDSLTRSDFSITNPGENWQVGCVVMEKLPERQLVYLGLSNNIVLFSYFTGGVGKSEHILIIKFKNKKIIDFWCGNVLVDLKNKTDILKYLKTNKDKHFGLNTNVIYL